MLLQTVRARTSIHLRSSYFVVCSKKVVAFGKQDFRPNLSQDHTIIRSIRMLRTRMDGSFQMTATELSTAARYRLDPIIVLLNNHGYGTERPLIEGDYNDIHNWHYAKLPLLLGKGYGIRVKSEVDFEKALELALNTRGEFFLIEVELDKLDFSEPLKRLSEASGKICRGED